MSAWARTAAFYGFFFGALGAWLPFWPVWMQDWGLSEAEVGNYLAIAVIARVAFGVGAPWLADLTNAPRRALALMGGAAAALFLAHLWIEARWLLLAATLATAGMISGITPVADALSLRAAERHGFAYATARSVGSAAFMAASLICGFAIAAWGSGAALWWIVLCFLPLVWLGRAHPGGAGAPEGRPRLAEAGLLIRSPAFLLAALAAAAVQGSHAALYAYGSIHWRGLGIGDGVIGGLWAFGVVAEVAVMALWGRRMIAWLGAPGAVALAAAAGALRWLAMVAEPALIWLWPLQALHGLSFTAAHLGLMAFVQAAAPARLASTAQGLAGGLIGGVTMSGAAFVAASVYPVAGAGVFWVSAALAMVGLAAALVLRRVWDGGRLSV